MGSRGHARLLVALMSLAGSAVLTEAQQCGEGEYRFNNKCMRYKKVGSICKFQRNARQCEPPSTCVKNRCEINTCEGSFRTARRNRSNLPNREPWEGLNDAEIEWVSDFVVDEFNLIGRPGETTDPWIDDTLLTVELEEPEKGPTLRYLDDGANPPQRFARAVVSYGSDGYLMEYRVGPLAFPRVSQTRRANVRAVAVNKPGDTPLKLKPLDGSDYFWMERKIRKELDAISDFMRAAFGSSYGRGSNSNLDWYIHQHGVDRDSPQGYVISWMRTDRDVDNAFAFPLPFQFYLDMESGVDDSNWKLREVYYQDQYFDNINDFRRAWNNGNVKITPLEKFTGNPFWQTLNRRNRASTGGQRPPDTNQQPPADSVEPVLRYSLINDHWVEWMGWEFYVTNKQRTGMALYDVRFLEERIAYEMSIQELHAYYTGYAPHLARQAYFDTFFSIGRLTTPLKKGVDCPQHATYFKNFCLFEHDTGRPLWRKKKPGVDTYGGAKSTQLVLRAIYTIGNYDYVVDVAFSLDGQIDYGFSASGHVFMGAYHPKEEPFGTRLYKEQFAPLHTHFGGFKVDLDVAGKRKNCVEKTSVGFAKRENIPGMSREPSWTVPGKSLYLTRDLITNENDARIVLQNNDPAEFKVVSCDGENRWGYRRGYEIVHPNTPIALYEHPKFPSYHMMFTKHHDDEYELTGRYDGNAIATPTVRIEQGDAGVNTPLVNGESIEDEDIVAWISVGFYHVPRAEDTPVTNVIESSFTLRPSNYFDENPSMDLYQSDRYRFGLKREKDSMSTAGCAFPL